MKTVASRPGTVGEAMLAAFPDDRTIVERLLGWSPRLMFHVVRDHSGQRFAMLDGWPAYVRRACRVIRHYYVLEEGWCEPSAHGPFRTQQTWRLDPKASN
jgi:hypothetical protein